VLTAVLGMAGMLPSTGAWVAKTPGGFDSLDISLSESSLLSPRLPALGREGTQQSMAHKARAFVTWDLFEHPRVWVE